MSFLKECIYELSFEDVHLKLYYWEIAIFKLRMLLFV